MYSALFTFNTMTEVPLSKALNLQLLPGHRSINGCPLLRACVHCCVCVFTAVCVCVCVCTLDGLNAEHKFRVWVTILGHMSRHFHVNCHFGIGVSIENVIRINWRYDGNVIAYPSKSLKGD